MFSQALAHQAQQRSTASAPASPADYSPPIPGTIQLFFKWNPAPYARGDASASASLTLVNSSSSSTADTGPAATRATRQRAACKETDLHTQKVPPDPAAEAASSDGANRTCCVCSPLLTSHERSHHSTLALMGFAVHAISHTSLPLLPQRRKSLAFGPILLHARFGNRDSFRHGWVRHPLH